jgi:hypothetical protein
MSTLACTVSIILASLGQCGPGGCATGVGYAYGPAPILYGYGSSCIPVGYGYAPPVAVTWHPALMQGYGYAPRSHYAVPFYSYAASPTWMGGAAGYSGGYGVPYTPYYPVVQPVNSGAFYAPLYAWAPAHAGPVAEVAVADVPVRRGLFGGGRGFHPLRSLFGGGGARRGFFRGGCG